jgi:polar amino acid transport system substrate-binding protein
MRKRFIVFTLLACCLHSPGFAADTLRVGMSPDYEPLAFLQDGEVVGIEADNAREVGKLLGRPVEIVPLPFERLIPTLQSGGIDVIMSGLTATDERRRAVAFADPFMEVGQMAIIRVANAGPLSSPGALFADGMRVGVEPGTTGESFARETLTGAEIVSYADPAAAFAGLRSNAIHFYIHDAPTSWKLSQSREDQDLLSLFRPLTSEQLAWAVARDDQRLLLRLNAALATLRDTGRLRAIQNYWIPVRVSVQ